MYPGKGDPSAGGAQPGIEPMSRRGFGRIFGGAAMGLALGRGGFHLRAASVSYPVRKPLPAGEPPFSWPDFVRSHLPPLRHARGSRWPLVTWEGFSFQPQPREFYQELLRRGFTQHIRLEPGMIETALAIQAAGSPVIAIEGRSGAFPASLTGDPATWAHVFDAGYQPKEPARPCPALHRGWAKFADELRGVLGQFRSRGVTVDAVWADWEGDPLYGDDRFEQARHCRRCRETLPAAVLASEAVFKDYTTRKFYELFGAYYAAPVLEYYPRCSVTDWLAQPSTPEEPQWNWNGTPGHPVLPPWVTAYNPTAYGAASWFWKGRPAGDRRSQGRVDHVYTHLLLRQVSRAGALGARWAPEKELVPWVARWVTEPPETEFPVMSRECYREVLRHLWLRGVAAMQVFNPRMKDFEEFALAEMEDTAAVYDEMLEHRDFFEGGTVLNRDLPAETGESTVWSGLRWGDRAVVRVFRLGTESRSGMESVRVSVRLGPGETVPLAAHREGRTYLLERVTGAASPRRRTGGSHWKATADRP